MKDKFFVTNPITKQDYPDPDVIRVGDTYYMISTTMHFMPGGVILRSYDLAHWEIASYVYDTLDDTPGQRLEGEEHIYGKGMWAASLRYHNGLFYVCFVANDTHKTYLFQSESVEGPWRKSLIEGFYHDCSLFFEGERIFLVYGHRTIFLTELNEDLTAPKQGGLHRMIVEDKDHPSLGYEGSHLYKIRGKYYLFLIHSLRTEWYRTEACFVADSLEGEFSGRDVLCDDMGFRHSGVAQGGIVDTPNGDWYSICFQDRDGVGRVPMLIPIHWEDGEDLPVFGMDGKVPKEVLVQSLRPQYKYAPLFTSDDFDYVPDENGKVKLKLPWQWNHNPKDELWSVTARKKALRLISGKICDDLTKGYNTLTQRTAIGRSIAEVTVDASAMEVGDRAGLAAFLGPYGAVEIERDNEGFAIKMVGKDPNGTAKESKEFQKEEEYESVRSKSSLVRLRCVAEFGETRDTASFFYQEAEQWILIGREHKLIFRLDHFTGSRFGLFYYSTKKMGGYVDFMNFTYEVEPNELP